MAANGRGAMRPQSRSPPFLVIGLLVALVILGANYWSLSSNNSSLGQEIAELQDQVRQMSSKRISAEKKIDSMAENYNKNKDALAQKESDVKAMGQQLSDKLEQIQTLGKDKEQCLGSLKNCEENSNGIQQELQKVKEELEEMKKAEQARTESVSKCDQICANERKMVLAAVEKTLGINSVHALHQAGVDVGEFKDKFGMLNKESEQNQPSGQQKQSVNQQAQDQQPQGQNQPPQGQPLQGQQQLPGQSPQGQQPQGQNQPPQGQPIQGQVAQGQSPQGQLPGQQQQGDEKSQGNQQSNPTPKPETKSTGVESQNKDDKVNVSNTTPMPYPVSTNSSTPSRTTTAKIEISTNNASISGLKEAAAADKDYNQVQNKDGSGVANKTGMSIDGKSVGKNSDNVVGGDKKDSVTVAITTPAKPDSALQNLQPLADRSGFQINNLVKNFKDKLPAKSMDDLKAKLQSRFGRLSNASNIVQKAGDLVNRGFGLGNRDNIRVIGRPIVRDEISPNKPDAASSLNNQNFNAGGGIQDRFHQAKQSGVYEMRRPEVQGQMVAVDRPERLSQGKLVKKDPNYEDYEDDNKIPQKEKNGEEDTYDDDDDTADKAADERLKFKSQKDVKAQDDSIDKLRRKMDQQIQQK